MKKKYWKTEQNKYSRKITIGIVMLVATLLLGACQQLDVIGKYAKSSFEKLTNLIPEQIANQEEENAWSLSAPDQTATFYWSKDTSKSTPYDVWMTTESAPFVEAGLDVKQLPEKMVENGQIVVGTKLGEDTYTYKGDVTAYTSFAQLVDHYRTAIGYHETLDHYGVDLGDGNKFEWAKDYTTNAKDIVFVLDPQVFIDAGVNPDQVKGWVYADVQMKNSDGKSITVKKFLKPFDLSN